MQWCGRLDQSRHFSLHAFSSFFFSWVGNKRTFGNFCWKRQYRSVSLPISFFKVTSKCILYLFSFFTVKSIPLALLVHPAPIQPFSTTRSPPASASTPLLPPCRHRRRDAASVDAAVLAPAPRLALAQSTTPEPLPLPLLSGSISATSWPTHTGTGRRLWPSCPHPLPPLLRSPPRRRSHQHALLSLLQCHPLFPLAARPVLASCCNR